MTELQWSLNFELKLEAKRMTRWSSYTHNKKMGNEHETKKKRKTKIKKKDAIREVSSNSTTCWGGNWWQEK